jgi:hypothetical protein
MGAVVWMGSRCVPWGLMAGSLVPSVAMLAGRILKRWGLAGGCEAIGTLPSEVIKVFLLGPGQLWWGCYYGPSLALPSFPDFGFTRCLSDNDVIQPRKPWPKLSQCQCHALDLQNWELNKPPFLMKFSLPQVFHYSNKETDWHNGRSQEMMSILRR